MIRIAIATLVLAACGGGGKKPDTAPAADDTVAKPEGNDGAIVPPETMDEIQRSFDRKRATVSRCLSAVVDSKELPKNARGKITLGVTIGRSGKADEVKIIKDTLDSKPLEECVIGKVKEIQFPEVPESYPTSYTYGFEAM